MRNNARNYSKDKLLNTLKIEADQKEAKMAKSRAWKEKWLEYDKTRLNKFEISDIDKENKARDKELISRAQMIFEKNEDAVKRMEKHVLYAKIATIRDMQWNEHQQMENWHKRKESKLDIMMEIERLKELKVQEDRELVRKKLQREGSLVIMDQIKERENERIRQKELLEKEREEINKLAKVQVEEEKRQWEAKKIFNDKISKEIEAVNKITALNRDKMKLEEKEIDIRIMRYNQDKARKEEAEMAEKKRLFAEKEMEVQKLRLRQEKAADKQTILDALFAKRAFEENERKIRQKDKDEIIIRKKKIDDLLKANERQKIDKELKLGELAKQEQEEYEKVVKKQIEDIELERSLEQAKHKRLMEHNMDIRTMIKMKEEKEKMWRREVLEEGRKISQNWDSYRSKMEIIKQEKLKELRDLNVLPKYIVDLERFKI